MVHIEASPITVPVAINCSPGRPSFTVRHHPVCHIRQGFRVQSELEQESSRGTEERNGRGRAGQDGERAEAGVRERPDPEPGVAAGPAQGPPPAARGAGGGSVPRAPRGPRQAPRGGLPGRGSHLSWFDFCTDTRINSVAFV
jgi:hypothetical protein